MEMGILATAPNSMLGFFAFGPKPKGRRRRLQIDAAFGFGTDAALGLLPSIALSFSSMVKSLSEDCFVSIFAHRFWAVFDPFQKLAACFRLSSREGARRG